MKNIYVEFKENGKKYIFDSNNIETNVGDYVVVETERGTQIAKIVGYVENDTEEREVVLYKATKKDLEQDSKNKVLAEEAMKKAQELADESELDMKFIDSYYTLDQKQLVLNFASDIRIDFRDLAKSLAAIYKTRIELRQVGIRDKAKKVSGIGMCGRKLCCSCFLNDLDSVGISMVKNQNLSLNPNKINGLCGRLLCCLKYEDKQYSECKKKLPTVGKEIEYNGFKGIVKSLNVLEETYVLENENGEEVLAKVKGCSCCERKRNNK